MEDFAEESINKHKKEGITVILPTYNMGAYLKRAIDSILNQTRLPEEILIIDDCSTDNTSLILDSYSDCPLISWVRLGKNIGAYQCRNLGLLLSKGSYITFHDADDSCDKRKLETQINLIETPINGFSENSNLEFRQKLMPRGLTKFPDVAVCTSKRIELNGEVDYRSSELIGLISYFFPNLVSNNRTPYFHIIGSLVRRQLFCEFGGFLPYRVSCDDELRNRIVAYGGVFSFDPTSLYTFHKTKESLTKSKQTGQNSSFRKKIKEKIAVRSNKMLQFRERESFLSNISVTIDVQNIIIDDYHNLKSVAEDIPCTKETKKKINQQLSSLHLNNKPNLLTK